jgi:carbon monoxide dehydrogenase subunit G
LKISGTAQVPFPPERTFQLLQDPVILAKAIPGCQELEKTGEDEYRLKMKMVLASLSGAFDGKVKLTEPNPPSSFKMLVEGSGKIGFMKGEGLLKLSPTAAGTEVAYDGDAQIGGTMAAVGQRLIDVTARMLIKRFFEKLSEEK